jgi:Na+-transporting NADH:ubiquinone oxidoreductase subunit NqrD
VVTALVWSLLLWAHWGLKHGVESKQSKRRPAPAGVDGWARSLGLGWVLLGIVAVQGLFGMVPAMSGRCTALGFLILDCTTQVR